MIPPNAMQLVKDLHATYVARSGYEIALNMQRENGWREWCQFGDWKWTVEDLARVIVYLQAQIREAKRNTGALRFSNLIGQPDKFEEDLQLALNHTDEKPTSTNRRSDGANRPGRYS